MPMRRPRIRRSASPSSSSTSVSPRRIALPGSIRPGGGTSRSSARLVRLLPHPDSPTRARVSPRSSVKLTPSTGCTGRPPSAGNETRRFSTSSTRVMRFGGPRRRASASPNRLAESTVTTMARPGKMRVPGRCHQHRLGVEDHAAPGGRRRLDAEAEEREPRLEQNHVAHAERRRHQQRSQRVGQQVPQDNPPPARAERLRGRHEALFPDPEHLGAHQAAGAEPPGRADEARTSAGSGIRSQTASTSSRMKSRGMASAPSTSRMSAASTAPPK